MPPRGSEGLDFTPILTHYLFLFTSILAIVSISCPITLKIHSSSPTGCLVYNIYLPGFRRSPYVLNHTYFLLLP